MSTETGSIASASVAILAALGFCIALRNRKSEAAFLCGIVGGVAFLLCFALGGEIRRQEARNAELANWNSKRAAARRDLLAKYPIESLEGRLPQKTTAPHGDLRLSSESSADLDLVERATDWRSQRRHELLKALHEGTVEVFSDEVGQGYGRMPYVTKKILDDLVRKDEAPMQPEIIGSPDVPLPPAPEMTIEASLKTLHRSGVEEFANAQDFGFVLADGKQAVGFLSHRFTKPVKADPRRKLQRFDLVGLLMHHEPVVYVSDKLPRMDELKEVPKRKLDRFETTAVAALRDGESVVIGDDESGPRMVGAIRAAKQCLTCHETRRGELLGAFTYRFERN